MAGSGGSGFVDENEYYWTYDATFEFPPEYGLPPVCLKGVYGVLDFFIRLFILDEVVIWRNEGSVFGTEFAERYFVTMYKKVLQFEVSEFDALEDSFSRMYDACYANPDGYAGAVAECRDEFLAAASGIEDDSHVAELAPRAVNEYYLEDLFKEIEDGVPFDSIGYMQSSSSKEKPQYSWAVSGGGSMSDQRLLLATTPPSWATHDGSSLALGANPVEWREPSGMVLSTDGWAEYVGGGSIVIPQTQEEFNSLSWEELEALSAQCAATDGSEYMALLGFTKDVKVTGVGTVKARLIGLNHDELVSGGKAGFTFQLTDGLSTSAPASFQMNSSDTNSGGWASSLMRSTNLPKLKAALPADLQGVIKKVTKKTSTANSGTAVSDTEDDLFLLSLVESIGTTKTAYTDNPITSNNYLYNEGTQYEYYKQFDSNKTEAFNHHIINQASGSAQLWWLRSINLGNAARFYYMAIGGDWSNGHASNAFLPAVGFCLSGADSGSAQPGPEPWRPPEDIADASWEDISELANHAAKNPDEYMGYLGQEKTFEIKDGETPYTVTARIVGVGQDDLEDGGTCGFTFEIYKGMGAHSLNDSADINGYASTSMKTWLEGLTFPADLQPYLKTFAVKYRTTTSSAASTIYARVALCSARNLYWPGCMVDLGTYSAYFFEDEGPTYQYFRNNDTTDARIHFISYGASSDAWLLSPYSSSTFMAAGRIGEPDTGYYVTYNVPTPRFCLGTSSRGSDEVVVVPPPTQGAVD